MYLARTAHTKIMTEDTLREMLEKERQALNQELSKFFGDLVRHVDARVDSLRDELAPRIDHAQNTLDAILKNQETDQQERTVVNHQLDRHEHWHHKTADHIGLHLDYNQAA